MRTVRQIAPGLVYHLISRFVDQRWFLSDDDDSRENYLRLLGRAMSESDWRCLAYALMSSHLHLAMVAGDQSLAAWTGRVHGPFALTVNAQHARIGPVFVRGPKDYSVPVEKVGKCIAYLHNNPVRAHVVGRASASSWTSHRAYVGHTAAPGWLCVEEGLARAGFEDRKTFDGWVDRTPGDPCRPELGRARKLARLRGAIEIATPAGTTIPLVMRPHAHVRIDPRLVMALAAAAVGVTPMELGSRGRLPAVIAGRRVAVHAARALGVAGVDIAAALGLTPSAVSQIARATHDELRDLVTIVVERARAA
jgi:hypothetical protein